nr:FtsK/SpoIIIE domain-containing protein [Caldilineaceae bacterium]
MPDPITHAAQEIALINDLFRAHGVRAGIDPSGAGSLIAPQYWSYLVRVDLRETPESVHKLHRAIANLIANQRQARTPVRISDAPLAIELPALQPRPLTWRKANWKAGPERMIAGKRYSLFHGEEQIVIDLARQPHTLVAGATGAGKSVLLQMLVVSLAVNTPPDQIELWFCDLKNDDLVALRGLPHIRCQATSERQAAALIDRLHAEKERRIATHTYDRRILLVVDEQAELARLTDTVAQMNSLLSVGRSIAINLLIATQEPTKAVLGGLSSRNF